MIRFDSVKRNFQERTFYKDYCFFAWTADISRFLSFCLQSISKGSRKRVYTNNEKSSRVDCTERKSTFFHFLYRLYIVFAWTVDVRLFLSFCLQRERERHKKSRKWQKLRKIYTRKFHPKFFLCLLSFYMKLRTIQSFCRIIYSPRIIGWILLFIYS